VDLDEEIASLRNAVEEELSVPWPDAGTASALDSRIVDQVGTRWRPRRRRRRRWAKALALYVGVTVLMIVVGILAVQATGAS